MPVVPSLQALVSSGDLDAVDDLLRSLDGADLTDARAWFAGSRPWFRAFGTDESLHAAATGPDPRAAADAWFERHRTICWIEAMCAVVLCGPATAARRVPWQDLWDHQEERGEAAFVHLLWDAAPGQVAAFAEAASRVSLGSNARNTNRTLSRVLRAAVVHHALPCPSGRTFLAAWRAGAERESLLASLRADPLMPDLVHHFLACGHSGREPELASVLPVLVAEGRVERARLVEQVLELLTAPQRVASQRVLAGLVGTLRITADEVPGALPYLLGVLATSDGSVGVATLPLALELVDDAEALLELTTVVAGRPERRSKQVLLRALKADRVRTAAGDQAVLEALRLLAEGDQDAAFVDEVTRVLTRRGADGVPVAAAAPSGLWHRTPPAVELTARHPWQPTPTTTDLMRRSATSELAAADLELTLDEIARERFSPDALLDSARHLLAAGELSAPGTARLFEELFLAGAMRATWPTALAIADAACATARRPAALAVLLRMLASYAPEVPGSSELPRHLAALARQPGSARARQEALHLGAALAGEQPGTYERRLQAGTPPPASRARRGLWDAGPPSPPLPVHLPVPAPRALDLADLRARAKQDRWDHALYLRDTAGLGAVPRPSLLLTDVLRAACEFGPEEVGRAVRGIQARHGGGPVGLALDLWSAGHLTVPVFWHLALHARTDAQARRDWQADPELSPEQALERWREPRPLAGQLDAQAPVLPGTLDGSAARLSFLLSCESLLRAGQTPEPLSTPSWQDGSLDLDTLLARLWASAEGGVGPLDLLQALHRLRPVAPARAHALDLPPVRTVAALSDPDAGTTLDAVELVRTWIAAGGLPDLRTTAADGRWRFSADVPVPWTLCPAAPVDLLGGGLGSRDDGAVARVFPLWPDLTRAFAHAEHIAEPEAARGLARLGGTFGLASHDHLLACLSQSDDRRRAECIDVVAELLGHDRLDADQMAAAALGRIGAGTMALARSVSSWEQLIERGRLRRLWPLALAVAAAACEPTPKPAGLPALLRLLAQHAHEVPAPTVPDGVRRLADARGATRSQVEARALVAALTAAGAPAAGAPAAGAPAAGAPAAGPTQAGPTVPRST